MNPVKGFVVDFFRRTWLGWVFMIASYLLVILGDLLYQATPAIMRFVDRIL